MVWWWGDDFGEEYSIYSSVYDIASKMGEKLWTISEGCKEMRYLENRYYPISDGQAASVVGNTKIYVDSWIGRLYFTLAAEGCFGETI